MYEPEFRYTNKIVNNIAAISSAREIIYNARIVPSNDLLLRDNALKKVAHASTAIEGNPLTLKQVDDLLKGKKVIAAEKAKKEVLNYYNVIENIGKYQNKGKITEKLILKLHNDVTKGTLNRPECEWEYRDSAVIIGNPLTGEVRYTPPNPIKVPELMENFVEWINHPNDLNPILIAGIAHYELVRIHPFVDGNGRTARALATLILHIQEFDIKGYFALDEYYNTDREAYVDALKSADKTHELAVWLEYFSNGFLTSILKVKEEVLKLSPESRMRVEEGQIRLNEKQREIIVHIRENGRITNSEVQELFKISPQAAHKQLKKMVDFEILDQKGTGKSTHYTLKSS